MKVVQNNETVGDLPCEYSQILWLSHMAKKLQQTPVRRNGDSSLVGVVVRVKWKLIIWKNCWRARYADKHATQTSPLGATTHEKGIEQQQHALSFFCLFLDILRSLMNIN